MTECCVYHAAHTYIGKADGINALRHKVLFNLFQQKVLANYAIENSMQRDEKYLLIISFFHFSEWIFHWYLGEAKLLIFDRKNHVDIHIISLLRYMSYGKTKYKTSQKWKEKEKALENIERSERKHCTKHLEKLTDKLCHFKETKNRTENQVIS